MRLVAVCLFLAGTVPGWAGPGSMPSSQSSTPAPEAGTTNRPINLSAFNAFRNELRVRQRDGSLFPPAESGGSPAGNEGIVVGPFQTEFARQTGKHANFARFRLNGVTVLGASIAGSVDGRSAHVELSWPTNP